MQHEQQRSTSETLENAAQGCKQQFTRLKVQHSQLKGCHVLKNQLKLVSEKVQ